MSDAAALSCDVLVIGGGINGAGIARDAAGRGLSVVLCERDDLAAHTSSASTKLIHGGLRYLEHYEFGLVRKALIEREVLLRAAPHIIWPLRFVMPHEPGQRPAWMIRIGLFLYDHLAQRALLPASCAIDLRRHAAGAPLKNGFTRGFMYSDGWVDDARLVILNAMSAAQNGTQVITRTQCVSAHRIGNHWHAELRDAVGQSRTVTARALVNAAGPWTAQFLQQVAHQPSQKALRLIKGSHIVVPRLFPHSDAYIFQHTDHRIVFAIPYEGQFTLIGTTDIDYHGDPASVAIDADEVVYLCKLANHYFAREITTDDVIWSYSGVRPLVDNEGADASAVTRDYRLELDLDGAPLLSVFGGKITTFRKLAEEAVDLLASPLSNRHGHWTADACLPGGDLFGTTPCNRAVSAYPEYLASVTSRYAWLPAALVARLVRQYGSRIDAVLAARTCVDDMGQEIVPGLYAAEVVYLVQNEWARTAADILWRRTKLGLHLPHSAATVLERWMQEELP